MPLYGSETRRKLKLSHPFQQEGKGRSHVEFFKEFLKMLLTFKKCYYHSYSISSTYPPLPTPTIKCFPPCSCSEDAAFFQIGSSLPQRQRPFFQTFLNITTVAALRQRKIYFEQMSLKLQDTSLTWAPSKTLRGA